MKNLFILTVFSILALTSCKKDYTCECKTSVTGYGVIETTTSTINNTKSKAKDACDKLDESYIDPDYGLNVVKACEIK